MFNYDSIWFEWWVVRQSTIERKQVPNICGRRWYLTCDGAGWQHDVMPKMTLDVVDESAVHGPSSLDPGSRDVSSRPPEENKFAAKQQKGGGGGGGGFDVLLLWQVMD